MLPRQKFVTICALCIIPLFIVFLSIFGAILADSVYIYSGVALDVRLKVLAGEPSIDPNFGFTSFALGVRSAFDVISGHLPLWNHYEGLGAPLLGEMQSAAMFPFTWLLALPHGQALEQASLQLLAGIATFLFFRKFGLGVTAALTGGVLFEVNGVFAWLRNAVFNPVAFLPWLFFAVECFRTSALLRRTLSQRMPMICVGATMAALALYAGFPEEVYLYSLLLISWVVFRMIGLSRQENLSFLSDLLLTGLIALALSLPVLDAFADLLINSEAGGHSGNGFYGRTLATGALIQYIAPYVFGPIFAISNQDLRNIWGDTGGYIGFSPVVVAIAGLFASERRAIKIFLVVWIVIALGVTYGLPVIYPAFMILPLTKMAACYRYINVSWIFCTIFLVVLFIDHIPTLPQPLLRRILRWAVAVSLISVAATAFVAWPLIFDLWTSSNRSKAFATGALLSIAILSYGILHVARNANTRGVAVRLSAIVVAEVVVWFFVPYLSYPRAGKLDESAISFLQANVGLQRVVNATGAELAANYGSYFGIPTLNYNDSPVPKRTADYIKEVLDPYADPMIFLSWFPGGAPEQQADRKRVFHERLSRYAQAGVKYVLAGADLNSNPAFHLLPDENYPYGFATGQRMEIAVQENRNTPFTVTAVSLLIGTYSNTASGHLKVTFCVETTCVEGLTDVGKAEDNRPLQIALDHAIQVDTGKRYTIRLEKLDGDKDVAIWMYPLVPTDTATQFVGEHLKVRDHYLPDFRLIYDVDAKPVLRSRSMTIYELSDPRKYFSDEACELTPVSHDHVDALCLRPSKLIRLEIFMPGWSATVNGQTTPVSPAEDGVFQALDLPAGASHIDFQFEPRGFRWALIIACAALSLVMAVFARAICNTMRRVRFEQPR